MIPCQYGRDTERSTHKGPYKLFIRNLPLIWNLFGKMWRCNIYFFFDANRYSSVFTRKAIQNKEIGSLWLTSWRDVDTNVRHDIAYKAETNNQAEYTSMLNILKHIRANAPGIRHWLSEATIIGDSQLVINQMTGEYAIKEEGLRPLFLEAVNLVHVLKEEFDIVVRFYWVPRELNNEALDLTARLKDLPSHLPVTAEDIVKGQADAEDQGNGTEP